MKLPGVFKKLAIILGFVALFSIGYLSSSVVTSCTAQAQSCCGGRPCTYIVGGVATAIAQISGYVNAGVTAASGFIIAYYTLAAEAFGQQMSEKIKVIFSEIIRWFDTFWFYQFYPSLQDMTEQLNVIDAEKSRQWAAYQDGAEQSRVINLMAAEDINSQREYYPGENVCVAGTVVGGLARASAFRKGYERAAPLDELPRQDNRTGSPSENGAGADMNVRYQNYLARYCRSTANAGNAGCATDAPFVDLDVDVTGQVFAKDTIDVKDPEVKRTVDDLIRNIAEPFALNNIPADAIGNSTANERLMEYEAYKAKRQAVVTALNYVVARRAPGSNMGPFLEEMRIAAGINTADISANPSYNEVLEVMMNERFRTGSYAIEQVDFAENNNREMVIQQAFQVMQMSDHLEILDRYALILSAQAGMEVNETRPPNARTEEKPLR